MEKRIGHICLSGKFRYLDDEEDYKKWLKPFEKKIKDYEKEIEEQIGHICLSGKLFREYE